MKITYNNIEYTGEKYQGNLFEKSTIKKWLKKFNHKLLKNIKKGQYIIQDSKGNASIHNADVFERVAKIEN